MLLLTSAWNEIVMGCALGFYRHGRQVHGSLQVWFPIQLMETTFTKASDLVTILLCFIFYSELGSLNGLISLYIFHYVSQINSEAIYCGNIVTGEPKAPVYLSFNPIFSAVDPRWTLYNSVRRKKTGISSYFSKPWIKLFLLQCIKLCHFWHRFEVRCHDWCQSDI